MWTLSWESTATAPTWPQSQPDGFWPQPSTSSYWRSPASMITAPSLSSVGLLYPSLGMPTVPAFYSDREASRPAAMRVYHNNSSCEFGKQIPEAERRNGTNAYELCEDCGRLNAAAQR